MYSALMPPDNSSDFDMHLERNLQDLNNLRSSMTYEVFLVYCAANIPQIGDEGRRVAPRKIYDDLKMSGFKV